MHAAAAESLAPFLEPGSRALDVGSGSGYFTHVLAEMCGPGGRVVGIEHIEALRELGEGNVRRGGRGREMLEAGEIKFVMGDGRKGWPDGLATGKDGGYDCIHVGAAAKGIHPPLIEQLKAPGRMFIPVEEDFMQHIYVVDKKEDGSVEKRKLFGVQYVPLTDAPTA
ncbi:hypothetical protein LTR50_002195 [Elasticomyces elasticus]|nr:hypothetical protein LTR50_002195 [Elasticomyces elasticus]